VEKTVMHKLFVLLGILFCPLLLLAGPVDLNTADAETIARELDGVGTARAQAIVQYRDEVGRFSSIEDVLKVAGIGEHILTANRDRMTVQAAP
jgi:competence ComEA-like helix-hairpin-helix protein